MATSVDDDMTVWWAIRLDGEALTADEQDALDAWLGEDERRRGALLRAQAALSYLDRGRALATPGAPPSSEARPYEEAHLGRRSFLVGGGVVAGLTAVGYGGFLLLNTGVSNIKTSVGEIRRVPLADGSVASLNTDSRIAVAMAKKVRHVTLEGGEAWFQVAHDKARPFIVDSGDVRVEAVGTAFSVRKRENGVEILVTEGVVRAWIEGHEASSRRILAGSRAFVSEAAGSVEVEHAPQSVDRALAWRTGEIAIEGESLGYAVAEINRYNHRKLVVDDPALAREPLVGYFRTDDPENFGRAVAGMLDAHVVEEGDVIRITRVRA
jgi:transmembrane sensor